MNTNMKLLMIIYSGPHPDRVTSVLEQLDAPGYTVLDKLRGVGTTGRLEGTRAFPGTATTFLSILTEQILGQVVSALQALKNDLSPGEHLHAAVLPLEGVL